MTSVVPIKPLELMLGSSPCKRQYSKKPSNLDFLRRLFTCAALVSSNDLPPQRNRTHATQLPGVILVRGESGASAALNSLALRLQPCTMKVGTHEIIQPFFSQKFSS